MSQLHEREQAIFAAALELPSDEREAYLEQATAGVAGLRWCGGVAEIE